MTNVAYQIVIQPLNYLQLTVCSHYEGGGKRAVCFFAINGLPAKSASSAKHFAAFVVYPHMQQQLEWMKPRDRFSSTRGNASYLRFRESKHPLPPSGASPFLIFDLPA